MTVSSPLPSPVERLPLRELGLAAGLLLLSALALGGIGATTVYSAATTQGPALLTRQLFWLGLGLVLAIAAAAVSYHFLLRIAWWLYGLGVVAVLLILFFGHEAGGARSWIGLGGFGGQPSDFCKLATVLVVARYLGAARRKTLTLRHIGFALLITVVPLALVALQPDLGGAVLFLPIAGAAILVAGVPWRVVVATILLMLVASSLMWSFGMREFQKERVRTFLVPERDPLGSGYQIRQSKIAIGSGGTFGRGYLQGTQSRLRFLPARHTDFILAVFAEERGFAGTATVLLLYGSYFSCALAVALRARDREGVLLIAGLTGVLGTYVLYNTAMIIGLVPVTGIPLPFLSYGGSFTLFCFASTGLMIGVDLRRYVNR